MTSDRAAYRVSLLADYLEQGQAELIRDTEIDLLKTARRWSSGPFSLAELATRDHPYARRHGRPLLSSARINVQTGVFRDSWVASAAVIPGVGVGVRLYNTDDKASRFLEGGTEHMFARPIDVQILGECVPRLRRRVDRMIKAALVRSLR